MAKKKTASASVRGASGRSTSSKTAAARKKTARRSSTGGNSKKAKQKTAKRSSSSAAAASANTGNPLMGMEVFCWLLLAFAVLIFISLIGYGGKLGGALADLLFGLFGSSAYAFPFLIFFLTLFLMINRGSRIALIRSLSAAGLYLIVCGILQLVLIPNKELHSLREYFEVGKAYHSGGGAVGGALVLFFCPTVGVIGTYIVLFIALFILGALLTQKSLFVDTGRKGRGAFEQHRARSEELREERRERREAEHEIRRARMEAERAQKAQRRAEEAEDITVSPVFFSVLRKDSPADGSEAPEKNEKPLFTTDLFNGKQERKRAAKKKALTPADVIFVQDNGQELSDPPESVPVEASGGCEPDGSLLTGAASVSSRSGKAASGASRRDLFTVVHRDGSFVTDLEESGLPAKDSAVRKSGRKASDEDRESGADLSAVRENALAPDLVIQRGAGSGDFLPEEEIAETEDAPGITEEDIRGAGVSQKRKKAGKEQKDKSGKEQQASGEKSGSESGAGLTKKETARELEKVSREIAENESEEEEIAYEFPSLDLLKKPPRERGGMSDEELRETATRLVKVLDMFGVRAKVTNISCGPSVTRYELMPELGTKVSKITGLADDIKLNMAAADIRIEAPIPGKAAVGIEIPNRETSMVYLRELIDSQEFRSFHSKKLAYVVGKDIAGRIVVSDISKMPHLLIAGATGSGKSVFINTLVMSIIYNADPSDVKMLMIDPKVVELSVYNGIPHLYIPVVTDPKKAAGALNWGVAEMTRRYQMFAEVGVRNLAGYNAKAESLREAGLADAPKKMPQIVIIVDELADLMMVSGNEVEDAICRLAQLARACGIHLVIATQRPSVDVITGLIKANIPSRIAFSVSSGTDSRTILDMNGAEKLLGNGDMLFAPQTYKKPVRVQGAFVSDEEIQDVVDSIRVDAESSAGSEIMKKRMAEVQKAAGSIGSSSGGGDGVDELFADAGRFIIQKDKASIGMLQRWFKIGFNRAARIMDQLSDAGVVGPDEGTKPRKVIMTEEQFENYLEEN